MNEKPQWLSGEGIAFPSPDTVAKAEHACRCGSMTRGQELALASAASIYIDLLTGSSARPKLSRLRRVARMFRTQDEEEGRSE
ncbi:MAG: hypothetical protein O7A04_02135 [Acidobacteria bacterium]|nr:hypothetical protein [Acidobacteriota bacterium]